VIRITPAQEWEAQWLASHLRPEDAREVKTASGKTPEQLLPEAFALSKQCYTIRHQKGDYLDLNPTAMFGVCDYPQAPQWGVVWMLGSPKLSLVRSSVMHAAPQYLDKMGEGFEYGLHCLVDSRNTLHLRWLLRNRFRAIETINTNGIPFFYCQRPNDV
jgi:hypothetical protein